jgi:hypothetical protein
MEREFPPPPRASLQGSPLVGLLAHLKLGPAEHPATPPAFVQGLGRWLGWKEAIALSAVLQAPPAAAARAARPAPVSPQALASLERAFERVRATLSQAIADDQPTAREDGHSFLPFRRRCYSLQQAMDAATDPLRAQLRAAVARLSPALAQLAALDAAMAKALGPRQQALLAQTPVLLEQHFTRLRSTAQTEATPWLPRFRHDMQQLLLAELDLRLQPALGLLATLQQPQAAQPGHERQHDSTPL